MPRSKGRTTRDSFFLPPLNANAPKMKTYLVGGAVRDRLLGVPVKDRDWVVTGTTPEEMSAQGFKAVGRDFPVFLHPQSGEEYALARTERKSGHGYAGFSFDHSIQVTLEADLQRRDLTINAMAEDADGALIDPYGGQQDLEDRILRHVSPAFIEDPLRVLRVARFAARFAPLGFRIAPETRAMMQDLSKSGELDYLIPERTWQETERALGEADCAVYFETLRDCGALASVFPEIDQLFGIPQTASWHPEIDTGVHVMMVLRMSATLSESTAVRYAALTHDLGKGITPPDVLPSHRGHEHAGVPLVKNLCERLKVPRSYRDLAVLVCAEHLNCHRAFELRAPTVLKLLERLDAIRRPERFQDFLIACEADARGRKGCEENDYPQAGYLTAAAEAARAVDARRLVDEGYTGSKLGAALRRERLNAVTKVHAQRAPLQSNREQPTPKADRDHG